MTTLLNEIGRAVTKTGRRPGIIEGEGYRSVCLKMVRLMNRVTSPPYWNAIDYDVHTENGDEAWHRQRKYSSFE